MKRGSVVFVLLLAVLVASAGPAFAEQDTGRLAVTKLFRGIANAATGWMEIPKQVNLEWHATGPGQGMTWGLVKGVGWAIGRSVAGAYEIVTFPFPIPENYAPFVKPEYVLSDLPSDPQPR